jgi:hypothetical protein
VSGPFETSMQDMIGFMVFMYMAKSIVASFGGSACPLLPNVTHGVGDLVWLVGCYNVSCLLSCELV